MVWLMDGRFVRGSKLSWFSELDFCDGLQWWTTNPQYGPLVKLRSVGGNRRFLLQFLKSWNLVYLFLYGVLQNHTADGLLTWFQYNITYRKFFIFHHFMCLSLFQDFIKYYVIMILLNHLAHYHDCLNHFLLSFLKKFLIWNRLSIPL